MAPGSRGAVCSLIISTSLSQMRSTEKTGDERPGRPGRSCARERGAHTVGHEPLGLVHSLYEPRYGTVRTGRLYKKSRTCECDTSRHVSRQHQARMPRVLWARFL